MDIESKHSSMYTSLVCVCVCCQIKVLTFLYGPLCTKFESDFSRVFNHALDISIVMPVVSEYTHDSAPSSCSSSNRLNMLQRRMTYTSSVFYHEPHLQFILSHGRSV